MPRFVCPECRTDLLETGAERFACAQCGHVFDRRAGVWRFLTPSRGAVLEPFVRQDRIVRQREGRRSSAPEYYRALPSVASGDPRAGDWQLRRETYRHLLGHVLAIGPSPLRVLDLGAGTGWLSHRLATLGHQPVAVDAIDDDTDGLGATRHYTTGFAAVQADFNALPFAPNQFDLAVFNGSLHYAADAEATLAQAHASLASGGALVVMDSPMFSADDDAVAMPVRTPPLTTGASLTFARLAVIAEKLALQPQFVPSRGPFGWRLRRASARVTQRRAPAAFGLWVAR